MSSFYRFQRLATYFPRMSTTLHCYHPKFSNPYSIWRPDLHVYWGVHYYASVLYTTANKTFIFREKYLFTCILMWCSWISRNLTQWHATVAQNCNKFQKVLVGMYWFDLACQRAQGCIIRRTEQPQLMVINRRLYVVNAQRRSSAYYRPTLSVSPLYTNLHDLCSSSPPLPKQTTKWF